MRNFLTKATVFLSPLVLLIGCGDSETEDAIEDTLGVEAGTDTKEVQSTEKSVLHRETEEVVDPETGEVLSRETEVTPGTVKVSKEVTTEVNVDEGETTTTTEGDIAPDDVEDDD